LLFLHSKSISKLDLLQRVPLGGSIFKKFQNLNEKNPFNESGFVQPFNHTLDYFSHPSERSKAREDGSFFIRDRRIKKIIRLSMLYAPRLQELGG